MALATQSTKCPFCRESVLPGATRCKHCQAEIQAGKKKRKPLFSRFDNFRFGFILGLLFALTLMFLIYNQFN